jgi:hypothetical protein
MESFWDPTKDQARTIAATLNNSTVKSINFGAGRRIIPPKIIFYVLSGLLKLTKNEIRFQFPERSRWFLG